MKQKIKLGDKVRCKITGFIGIAVARTEFINGCVQYSVAPKISKDSKFPEEYPVDEQSLEVLPVKKKKIEKNENGGRGIKIINKNF